MGLRPKPRQRITDPLESHCCSASVPLWYRRGAEAGVQRDSIPLAGVWGLDVCAANSTQRSEGRPHFQSAGGTYKRGGVRRRVSVCGLTRSEGGGCRGIPISMLEQALPEFTLIINTVPAKIMDRNLLQKVRKDALILDLASKPGGAGAGDGIIAGETG